MAQTIATSLEKLNTALEGDKTALTAKKVTVPSTVKHSDIPKLIATVTNGMSAKITVSCSEEYNGTTLTFKNGSNVITAQVVGGKCEISPDKEGTWTITNTLDDQVKTCVVEFNYYELELLAKPVIVELCSMEKLNSIFVSDYYYSSSTYNLKFCHDKAPKSGTTDVSKNGDKSILMWVDGDTVKISSQEEKKKIHFSDCNFENSHYDVDLGTDTSIQSPFVHGSWNYQDSSDQDGYYTFSTTAIFKDIDLGDADFTDVKSLYCFFDGCSRSENINMGDVTGLDRGDVTNIADMFSYCSKVKSLTLPKIDTSNVTSMSYMFYYFGNSADTALNALDLSSWKTGNVANFRNMFYHANINTVDISNFVADKIVNNNVYQMFAYSNIKTIYCNNDWTGNTQVSNTREVFYRMSYLSGSKGTTGAYCKPADLGGNFTRK